LKWIKATKDTRYKTGDILWIKSGNRRGLAFIDSELSTGFPTCINSIPEAWSYDFDWNMQQAVFPRYKEYYNDPEDSDDQSNGEVRLGTTRLRDIQGGYCFTIEKVMRIYLTK
jgi:hypothetical protein